MATDAILMLEDGRIFAGEAYGARGTAFGEVVFNTSMTGYQEVLTDPSYTGQIVTMTYPLIGNYGVNPEDQESAAPQVAGFVLHEAPPIHSNWRAQESLDAYLARHRRGGASPGWTQRALTRHIRSAGRDARRDRPGGRRTATTLLARDPGAAGDGRASTSPAASPPASATSCPPWGESASTCSPSTSASSPTRCSSSPSAAARSRCSLPRLPRRRSSPPSRTGSSSPTARATRRPWGSALETIRASPSAGHPRSSASAWGTS